MTAAFTLLRKAADILPLNPHSAHARNFSELYKADGTMYAS